MKINIENVTRGKLIKDAITTRIMEFDSVEHAEKFAYSCSRNSVVDSNRKGTKVCKFRVVVK